MGACRETGSEVLIVSWCRVYCPVKSCADSGVWQVTGNEVVPVSTGQMLQARQGMPETVDRTN